MILAQNIQAFRGSDLFNAVMLKNKIFERPFMDCECDNKGIRVKDRRGVVGIYKLSELGLTLAEARDLMFPPTLSGDSGGDDGGFSDVGAFKIYTGSEHQGYQIGELYFNGDVIGGHYRYQFTNISLGGSSPTGFTTPLVSDTPESIIFTKLNAVAMSGSGAAGSGDAGNGGAGLVVSWSDIGGGDSQLFAQIHFGSNYNSGVSNITIEWYA